MTAKAARGEVRNMRGQYDRAVELHETLIDEEDGLREFAEMSANDYQRQFVDRFPALREGQPTLAGVVWSTS